MGFYGRNNRKHWRTLLSFRPILQAHFFLFVVYYDSCYCYASERWRNNSRRISLYRACSCVFIYVYYRPGQIFRRQRLSYFCLVLIGYRHTYRVANTINNVICYQLHKFIRLVSYVHKILFILGQGINHRYLKMTQQFMVRFGNTSTWHIRIY